MGKCCAWFPPFAMLCVVPTHELARCIQSSICIQSGCNHRLFDGIMGLRTLDTFMTQWPL